MSSIENIREGSGSREPLPPRPQAQASGEPGSSGSGDDVRLTAPTLAVRRLLRQRVIENVRLLLGVPRPRVMSSSVEPPFRGIGPWVGRLLSECNRLTATKAPTTRREELQEALWEGLEQGAAETLEILHELDELELPAWMLVRGLFAELHRKWAAVRGDS